MISAERLAQMERDLHEMAKRKTAVAIAAVDMGQKLIAEVRRLQAERAAIRTAFVQPGTEPVTEDMGKLARIVVEQLSEEVARVERMEAENAVLRRDIQIGHIGDARLGLP